MEGLVTNDNVSYRCNKQPITGSEKKNSYEFCHIFKFAIIIVTESAGGSHSGKNGFKMYKAKVNATIAYYRNH